MRTFDRSAADTYLVDRVRVARWEQYSLGDNLPFQAMWYTVPPESSSPRDCHPEVELSIVLSGSAAVEAGGTVTEVGPGSAFLLDSNEAHVVHNRSAGELVVFSAYWMPAVASAGAGVGVSVGTPAEPVAVPVTGAGASAGMPAEPVAAPVPMPAAVAVAR